MYDRADTKAGERCRFMPHVEIHPVRATQGAPCCRQEERLWVKADSFRREKKSLAAHGWASISSNLHPPVIPPNDFFDDKVVISPVRWLPNCTVVVMRES
jgi:hypothetical protein